MRFAFALSVVLAASFTLATAQTATIDPAVAPPKIDMTKTAPPPTSVNVLNFPEVQSVGGTVSVGNLPLDIDGAVRVTSTPARAPVLVEAIPGGVTTESGTHFTSPAVNTSGYSWVGFHSTGNWYGPEIEWRWAGTGADDFGRVRDNRNGPQSDCQAVGNGTHERAVCVVSGVEVRFHLYNAASVPVRLESIQVYLIP
jgi:hypothetical protein